MFQHVSACFSMFQHVSACRVSLAEAPVVCWRSSTQFVRGPLRGRSKGRSQGQHRTAELILAALAAFTARVRCFASKKEWPSDSEWPVLPGTWCLCYPQAKDATSTRDASEMAEEGAVQMDELFTALGIMLEALATSISIYSLIKPYAK